ncbi:MAG: DUF892 family protein [Armatimonadota bacterium]
MANEAPMEAIRRYLQDAIAAEKHFEGQLRTNAKDAEQPEIKRLFEQHAEETRMQHERLTARLETLGGSPSGMKSFMANLFGMAPKAAQMGHDAAERGTQDLIMAYAVEQSEIAMYEALIVAADAAGDQETAQLAREIQQQERRTAERVWDLVAPAARQSFMKVTGTGREARRAA